jgi:hypothetical protein
MVERSFLLGGWAHGQISGVPPGREPFLGQPGNELTGYYQKSLRDKDHIGPILIPYSSAFGR